MESFDVVLRFDRDNGEITLDVSGIPHFGYFYSLPFCVDNAETLSMLRNIAAGLFDPMRAMIADNRDSKREIEKCLNSLRGYFIVRVKGVSQ
jgi:hypothetical protein